jgi:hypothetical protein
MNKIEKEIISNQLRNEETEITRQYDNFSVRLRKCEKAVELSLFRYDSQIKTPIKVLQTNLFGCEYDAIGVIQTDDFVELMFDLAKAIDKEICNNQKVSQ